MRRLDALFHFESLESRIAAFFVGLLLVVQMAGFVSIRYAIEQSARNNLRAELVVGNRVFTRLLQQNSQQLVEATSVLAYDFGFREAIASQDRETIQSALGNHSARIKASGMALVNLDRTVIADTLDPSRIGSAFAFPELIAEAATRKRASSVRFSGGKAYQIVIVPVLAPLPIAWVVMSFVIDDTVATDLKRITELDVTFFATRRGEAPHVLATTLSTFMREHVREALPSLAGSKEVRANARFGEEEFETLTTVVEQYGDTNVSALLQRSLRQGMEPYEALQVVLLFLAGISLTVSLIGSVRIARRITRPVAALAEAARAVARGEHVQVSEDVSSHRDEIGALAATFNNMSRGLTERDQMRDLLGKVASPAIADQLLKQKIELGGEERIVTVLFADIRNFTSLCEKLPPHESLALLNRYLERISGAIEDRDGVIDKYTGDGVMALFGAPIHREDDAERAILAGLDMLARIDELGRELADAGMPNPSLGIGINTARVIAGNIGTATRLNYTVLGDGVNLAARLESLTKRYAVPIVVGEETRNQVPTLVYRELDKVRVSGKSVPVRVFQPLGLAGAMRPDATATLDRFHRAIDLYREREWTAAASIFESLQSVNGYERVAELYLGYIRQFTQTPPPAEWDGSFTLYEK